MSDDDFRKSLLKQECLRPLAIGCNWRWWLDTDRQSVPDSCGWKRNCVILNIFTPNFHPPIYISRSLSVDDTILCIIIFQTHRSLTDERRVARSPDYHYLYAVPMICVIYRVGQN